MGPHTLCEAPVLTWLSVYLTLVVSCDGQRQSHRFREWFYSRDNDILSLVAENCFYTCYFIYFCLFFYIYIYFLCNPGFCFFSAYYFKTSIASFAWQVWLFKWPGFCPSQPRMAIYLETCFLATCVGISQWCCCVCLIHDRLGVFTQSVTSSRLLFIRLMLLSVNLAKQSSMIGPKYKYLSLYSFLSIQLCRYIWAQIWTKTSHTKKKYRKLFGVQAKWMCGEWWPVKAEVKREKM